MKNISHHKDRFAPHFIINVGTMEYSLFVQCFDKGRSFVSHPWCLLANTFNENGSIN